jgi:uncharacterized RDD family membrane protein YckC
LSDLIHIQTPESVDLSFEPVGLGSRFLAALIDSVIQGVVLMVIGFLGLFAALSAAANAHDLFQNIAFAILLLLVGLLFGLYKMLFEAIWNGQTPGKRIAGIRVVRQNGLPVTFFPVMIRNLMRIIDVLPSSYVLGALCVLFTKQHQRLGDMAAGTVVVRDRKATAPVVPTSLGREPQSDLDRLTEHVHRLTEVQLNPVRTFLARRSQLESEHRFKLALRLSESLAKAMGWDETISSPESFLEEVLFVRSR